MSQGEDLDTGIPIILTETVKLYEELERNDKTVFAKTAVLKKKTEYIEHLQQKHKDNNAIIARKRSTLTYRNNSTETFKMQTAQLRDEAKHIYESVKKTYQFGHEIKGRFAGCGGKLEDVENATKKETTQYEQKIDELVKLLDQLTEKRNKSLKSLEDQNKKLCKETEQLKNERDMYDNQMKLLLNDSTDDDDEELETLDSELRELQNRLTILDDDHASLMEESHTLAGKKKELAKRYDGDEFSKLEERFTEVRDVVSPLSKELDSQKATESDLYSSLLALEQYEARLNQEQHDASKFLEDLEQNPYEGFSKMEQEIGKIRAEIFERKEKYSEAKKIGVNCDEDNSNKDEEIQSTSFIVEQLSSQLKEIENVCENLSSLNYHEQNVKMAHEVKELTEEQHKNAEHISKLKNGIEEEKAKLQAEKDKNELELVTIENDYLMEVKRNEKECSVTIALTTNLENEAISAENQVRQLRQTTNDFNEETQLINLKQQEVDKTLEDSQVMLKSLTTKKQDLLKSLENVTVATPGSSKGNEVFAKPKITPSPKYAMDRKKTPVAKRNWDDSDSSVEGEDLASFVNRKNKRQEKKK